MSRSKRKPMKRASKTVENIKLILLSLLIGFMVSCTALTVWSFIDYEIFKHQQEHPVGVQTPMKVEVKEVTA